TRRAPDASRGIDTNDVSRRFFNLARRPGCATVHWMNISRRTFLKATGVATISVATGCVHSTASQERVLVNDVHTQLNPTWVRSVNAVHSLDDVRRIIRRGRREGKPVSIAGGRHAAGGQQFGSNVDLMDTRELTRVLDFDSENGTIEVETGIQWPE